MHDFSFLLFNHGFEWKHSVCNSFHDLTTLSVNISNIAIVTINNVGYCCIIHNIRKSEASKLLENFVLKDCGYL